MPFFLNIASISSHDSLFFTQKTMYLSLHFVFPHFSSPFRFFLVTYVKDKLSYYNVIQIWISIISQENDKYIDIA